MRRDLIHAALALVLVPSTVATVLWAMTPPPTVLALPRPTHRVAVAVDEAMRGELASVVRGEGVYSSYVGLRKPDGNRPVMGEIGIPEDDPSFWFIPRLDSPGRQSMSEDVLEIVGEGLTTLLCAFEGCSHCAVRSIGMTPHWPDPMPVTLDEIDFDGRARDDRAVKVTVRIDTIGRGSIVNFHGDAALTRALSDRIADRLAHPEHRHESPEDRAALLAFFGSRPPDEPCVDRTASHLGTGPR